MLEKTLESPLDCKKVKPVNPKGNQPWTFIGRTDMEAEAPILWPPWCIEPTHFKKTLMLGKFESKRRSRWQRLRWLSGITDSMDVSLSKLLKIVKDREAWRAAVHEVAKNWTQLGNWITAKVSILVKTNDTALCLYTHLLIKSHVNLRSLLKMMHSAITFCGFWLWPQHTMGFPGGWDSKESPCNLGD